MLFDKEATDKTWILYVVEFSDCVGLFAKEAKDKTISSAEELTLIMRSLGFSPTSDEIEKYFKENHTGKWLYIALIWQTYMVFFNIVYVWIFYKY